MVVLTSTPNQIVDGYENCFFDEKCTGSIEGSTRFFGQVCEHGYCLGFKGR
jgi:hypothetical protein